VTFPRPGNRELLLRSRESVFRNKESSSARCLGAEFGVDLLVQAPKIANLWT